MSRTEPVKTTRIPGEKWDDLGGEWIPTNVTVTVTDDGRVDVQPTRGATLRFDGDALIDTLHLTMEQADRLPS